MFEILEFIKNRKASFTEIDLILPNNIFNLLKVNYKENIYFIAKYLTISQELKNNKK